MSTFAEWQPRYASHRVALFPVTITETGDKKPVTSGYLRTGLKGSAQLALKFAEAKSFGFACGAYNRITVVDMDDPDPAIIGEAENLFGRSPLIWRTGSGKFAMPFRYNGEARHIRPIPSLPIDILGGGFCVAPPSAGSRYAYEIIAGTLDDIDCLPKARMPVELATSNTGAKVPKGQRNNALFRHCNSIVTHCDSLDQLIDAAQTWADQQLAERLPGAEIIKTANSVWHYRGGRKSIMGKLVEKPQFEALAAHPEAVGVLAVLAAENGTDATFMLADGYGRARGWPRRLVPDVRKKLLDLGVIECVKPPRVGSPAMYRWAVPGVDGDQ